MLCNSKLHWKKIEPPIIVQIGAGWEGSDFSDVHFDHIMRSQGALQKVEEYLIAHKTKI